MTRDGIKKCLLTIKATFPREYKDFDENMMKLLIEIWNKQFEGCSDEIVFNAIENLISTSSYPPTIADIKNNMYEQYDDSFSDDEVWEYALEAGRNGIYGAKEEFNNLPEDIQKVVSIGTIKEIAMSTREEQPFIRKRIIEEYHELKDKKKRITQISMGSRKELITNG